MGKVTAGQKPPKPRGRLQDERENGTKDRCTGGAAFFLLAAMPDKQQVAAEQGHNYKIHKKNKKVFDGI
jgi:hypothetical protein